jgi:hypothetical protein
LERSAGGLASMSPSTVYSMTPVSWCWALRGQLPNGRDFYWPSRACSPCNAVHAFVVASALEFDSALIAIGDPADIRRLAARHRSLSVFSI